MATGSTLGRGRDAFDRRAWAVAYAELSAADRVSPLEPEDLEMLVTAAFLIGRDQDAAELSARVHREWVARGEWARAARCAFWLAFQLLLRGESARGGSWLTRAWRLLDDGGRDCVEQGICLCRGRLKVSRMATRWPGWPPSIRLPRSLPDSPIRIW
jgi:hypothetical protein